MAYYLVRTGKSGQYEEEAIRNGYSLIGWGNVGDINKYFADGLEFTVKNRIKDKLIEMYPEFETGTPARIAGELLVFLNEIKINDMIVLPSVRGRSNKIAVGQVIGDYEFKTIGSEQFHARAVNWIALIDRADLSMNAINYFIDLAMIVRKLDDPSIQTELDTLVNMNRGIGVNADEFLGKPRKIRDKKYRTVNENLTPAAILETVKIAMAMSTSGLIGTTNSGDRSERYNVEIKEKMIDPFKQRFGDTPNLLLKKFLLAFREGLIDSQDYRVDEFRFAGNSFKSLTWAGMYWERGEHEEYKASYSPQLYLVVNRNGMHFGFGYGDKVSDDDPTVQNIKGSQAAKELILSIIGSGRAKLFQGIDPEIGPEDSNEISPKDVQSVSVNWNARSKIVREVLTSSIGQFDLNEIHDLFKELMPLFMMTQGEKERDIETYADHEDDLEDVDLKGTSIDMDDLFFPEGGQELVERIRVALSCNKHIILIGPPGTGKTELAVKICEAYRGKDRYKLATASSDWSTYDTIGSYSLRKDKEIEFRPGIFLRCFKDETGDPTNIWLIVDEINRADIDKAFGAMFTTLTEKDAELAFEIDGRRVKLVGSPDQDTPIAPNVFIIPKTWRIIATMNTFDKSSLYEMSYAFMRRFAFIPLGIPSNITKDIVRTYVGIWNKDGAPELPEKELDAIAALWGCINHTRQIGPAVIRDIYRYVRKSKVEPIDYQSPLIMYVLPQFEGIQKKKVNEFIEMLKPILGDVSRIKAFADQMFPD